jgi:glycosyltransferase involved in cell wall biosynthesis
VAVAEHPAKPLVSVVVPVFGGERYVGEAIDSVAALTYTRVETIVVDDGSPDRSAEIASARPGVRVLREPHRGVAAARNVGIAAARGELIAFMDQDDLWQPSKLALQVALLDERRELDIALCGIEMVLLADTPRPRWVMWAADRQPGYVPSAWLVRREAFERVGRFDTSYASVCDADWLARAKDMGLASGMLPQTLVCWRIHDTNGSYDQATMRRETFRMLRATAARQRAAGGTGDAPGGREADRAEAGER